MIVYESEGRSVFSPPFEKPAPTPEQRQSLAKSEEDMRTKPGELLLVKAASINLSEGKTGCFGGTPNRADIQWHEYLGIIPAAPSITLKNDLIEIPVAKASTYVEPHRFYGKRWLDSNTKVIGKDWESSLNLALLNKTLGETIGRRYLVMSRDEDDEVILNIRVGDEQVRHYIQEGVKKRREQDQKWHKKWWEQETNAANMLTDYFRLQDAVGRVVLPLSEDLQKLNELKDGKKEDLAKFVNELIGLVNKDAQGDFTSRANILIFARAAVLAGLATSKETVNQPLASGISGANLVIGVGEVVRSVCEKYGIEAPEPPKPQVDYWRNPGYR